MIVDAAGIAHRVALICDSSRRASMDRHIARHPPEVRAIAVAMVGLGLIEEGLPSSDAMREASASLLRVEQAEAARRREYERRAEQAEAERRRRFELRAERARRRAKRGPARRRFAPA